MIKLSVAIITLNEEKNIAYEIIELEKVIESQYITRSTSTRSDELTRQSEKITNQNEIASKLSNLSLQLYGLFLKTGYVKNDKEHQEVSAFFKDRMPEIDMSKIGFREKLWLYKSYLWYSLPRIFYRVSNMQGNGLIYFTVTLK